jgi:SAM-dependent methyltransferase
MDSSETYKKFAQFYDTYVGNFCGDLPLYTSLCGNRNPIIEIGCGTGRVLQALLDTGHTVTGVDLSPDMLSIAEKKLARYVDSQSLTLINHDFRLSPLTKQFACALVTFYTFNYLLEDAAQSTFLKNIFITMVNRGSIVIDLFYPKPKSRPETEDQWEQSIYEVQAKSIVLKQKRRMIGDIEERIQIYTDGENSNEIQTLRRFNEKHRMHLLLIGAGFVKVRFTNGYDLSHFHELKEGERTTSGFVVMAEKP